MSTILETILKAKFLADEKQVEALAGIVGEGINASGTYLSVVLAHAQEAVGNKRKSRDTHLAAVDEIHERFYPAVCRGVGPPEMETDERNRRATFARTAASDLRFFIKQGGDLRALDAATVSKAKLRAEGKEVPTGTRTERSLTKAAQTWERAVRRLAKKDAEAARKEIIDQQAHLEALLEELSGAAPAKRRRVRERPAARASKGRRPARGAENRAH